MKPVVFDPDAEDEFDHAAITHEQARSGYGVRLRNAVRGVISTVLTHPAFGAKFHGTKCRQVILTDFEYSVIYLDRPADLKIIAVAHHKRKPGYWKYRRRRP